MERAPIASAPQAVLAIDAGGTYLKAALVGLAGEVCVGSLTQTPVNSAGAAEEILSAYACAIRQARAFANAKQLELIGVGISTPGPFDYANGVSLMTHKFQSLHGVRLRERFCADGLLPEGLPVVFQHDVHSFLLGEQWTGALRGVPNAAAITLGTGLGFGVIKGGAILANSAGGPHCSLFKQPYKGGILEDRISRRGIIAAYRQLASGEANGLDVADIAAKARAGDRVAAEVFTETGRILAEELSSVFAGYGVTGVVVGGQIAKSFDLFGPEFSRGLSQAGLKLQAAPGKNLDSSALLGAAKGLVR